LNILPETPKPTQLLATFKKISYINLKTETRPETGGIPNPAPNFKRNHTKNKKIAVSDIRKKMKEFTIKYIYCV
jgi:hypothetical protein